MDSQRKEKKETLGRKASAITQINTALSFFMYVIPNPVQNNRRQGGIRRRFSLQVTKEIGNTKIQQKSSEYQSEEVSKLVQESSRSVSTSSSRILSSSSSTVSSSATSQRISSSSVGNEGSSQVKAIEF